MIIRIIECMKKIKSSSIINSNRSTSNLQNNPFRDYHPIRSANVEANKYIRIAV